MVQVQELHQKMAGGACWHAGGGILERALQKTMADLVMSDKGGKAPLMPGR